MRSPDPIMPDSARCKRALLGLVLHNPRAFFAVVESHRLEAEHFDGPHRKVFETVIALREEGAALPEPDMVAARLLDEHATDKVLLLSENACLEANAAWWAARLWEHRAKRAVEVAAESIAEAAKQDDLDGATEAAGRAAEVVARSKQPALVTHVRDILSPWVNDLEAACKRGEAAFPPLAGWPLLDGCVGRLLPGELLIVGGPTSSGKSSLIRCMAQTMASAGQDVGIVSVEDTRDTWIARLVGDRSNVPGWRLRAADIRDEDWPRIIKASAEIGRWSLRLAPLRTGAKSAEVCAAMRQVTAGPGAIVFVDYLQAIRDRDPRGRHSELSDTLAALKDEAGKLGARLVVASQMNREGVREGRTQAPRLTSLKETGDAEIMAEAVALLWCNKPHEDREKHEEHCMQLHVVKAKSGQRGVVPLRWDGDRTRFEEAR